MRVWPGESVLPQAVLADGFQYSPGQRRVRTQMDRGIGKSRGNLHRPITAACALRLTRGELAAFLRFYDEVTDAADEWFILPDQLFDGASLTDAASNNLTNNVGAALTVRAFWFARFGEGGPNVTTAGLEFDASFTLDVVRRG